MVRISGIGVRNLRSLKQLDSIAFKPITILVGKNSAGKSTFARLLPLLKQSSEKSKKSPILWWGRLVDFGAFDDVYSSLSSDGFIDITVTFEVTENIFLMRTPYYRPRDIPLKEPGTISAKFRLGKNNEDNTTLLRELHLDIFGVQIVLEFLADSVSAVTLNRKPIEIPSNIRLAWQQGQLLPILRMINLAPKSTAPVSDEALFGPRRFARFGATLVKDAVSRFLHGNTQEDRKEEAADRLPIAPIGDFLTYCMGTPNSTTTWKSLMSQASVQSPNLRELHAAVVLYKLDLLLWYLDDSAQRALSMVSYLEPLRATAQRYYRREEISADELDPKGLNTPFFIQGLSDREKISLNLWTKENFGFTLSIRNAGGHLSLNIQSESDKSSSRNMADVGLGYSQLVPVALQLWAAREKNPRDSARRIVTARGVQAFPGRTVVVEQPELHLHPAYQAKLADVFAGSISSRESIDTKATEVPLTIIAETHSPNLISRLGELVSEGKLEADQVQILVFEEDEQVGAGTRVRVAKFNEEGVLKNWPIGFFDA